MYGLKLIEKPSGECAGDVVFIHGLDGDATTTWHRKERPEDFWPKWLSDDTPDVAVWTYGYEANWTKWKGPTMLVKDRATHLLEELHVQSIGEKHISFICHSLGGIIVKQLLRHARDMPENAGYQRILNNICGITFLATPHSGTKIADWLWYIGSLALTTPTVKELEEDAPQLLELNRWYCENARALGISTKVFYETQPTKGVLVVDEKSANPMITGASVTALVEDHITISKPDSKDTLPYTGVNMFLDECLKTSRESRPIKKQQPSQIVAPGTRDSKSFFFVPPLTNGGGLYLPDEIDRCRDDLEKTTQYILDKQISSGCWFEDTGYDIAATAQITELLTSILASISLQGELSEASKTVVSKITAAINSGGIWMLDALTLRQNEIANIGEDFWDRCYLTKAFIKIRNTSSIDSRLRTSIRESSLVGKLQKTIAVEHRKLMGERVREDQSAWIGAGFHAQMMVVSHLNEETAAEEECFETINHIIKDDPQTLGGSLPGYFAWHLGNVVAATNETNRLLDESVRERLSSMLLNQWRIGNGLLWGHEMPRRDAKLISCWGLIAFMDLLDVDDRRCRDSLAELHDSTHLPSEFRFDDIKAAVCYAYTLLWFFRFLGGK